MKRTQSSYVIRIVGDHPVQVMLSLSHRPRKKSRKRWSSIERGRLPWFVAAAFLLLTSIALAQTNGTVVNWQYIQGQGAGTNAFLIATLPASTPTTFDHLRLTATLDSTDGSTSNSAIDATFANRGTFAYFYTAKGANPTGSNVHIVAYSQADKSVNLYIVLENYYDSVTYTILESQQEQIFSSPPQQHFPGH